MRKFIDPLAGHHLTGFLKITGLPRRKRAQKKMAFRNTLKAHIISRRVLRVRVCACMAVWSPVCHTHLCHILYLTSYLLPAAPLLGSLIPRPLPPDCRPCLCQSLCLSHLLLSALASKRLRRLLRFHLLLQ